MGISAMLMHWHGIDLHWAYADLLPGIYRRTHCLHHAYDILHDALIRFALTRNPRRQEQPHAYLRIIVRNLLTDSYHEKARRVSLPEEENAAVFALTNQPFAPSAEHLADIQQRLHMLQAIIDRLPPRCRETFWLFRIEGLPQQEIAAQLGISLNMVQRHIMRAMLDLLEARDLVR